MSIASWETKEEFISFLEDINNGEVKIIYEDHMI